MQKRNLFRLTFIFFVFCRLISNSQSAKLDSLSKLLKKSNSDTTSIYLQNLIAEELFNSNPDTAYIILDKLESELSIKLKQKNNEQVIRSFKTTLAEVKNSKGSYFYVTGQSQKGINFIKESLSIREELNDEYGVALAYTNLGFFYYNDNDLLSAISFWQKALSISEKINNIPLQTANLNNLGGVYSNLREYQKSKEAYEKLLQLKLASKDEDLLESVYCNMASLMEILNEDQKAWEYVRKSIYYSNKTNDKITETSAYRIMAVLYEKMNKKDSAAYYYEKAYVLAKKGSFNLALGEICRNYATFYIEKGNYSKAVEMATEAKNLALTSNSPYDKKESYFTLSLALEKSGRIPEAFKFYKMYTFLQDSLSADSKEKEALKKQLEFEHDREKLMLYKEQEKKEAVELKEKQKQLILRNAFIIGFILVLMLAIVIFRSLQQNRNKNKIISQQKKLVEEKNKEVIDSIKYAGRIQQSLLPTTKYIEKTLKRLNE